MNLRELAAADMGAILENGAHGFGWPITVTAPDGAVAAFTGFSNDISAVIDPETGQAVSGRLATVALRIESLIVNLPGAGLPKGISDTGRKPWVVQFNDINGSAHTFKVQDGNPDRALGLVVCVLELYDYGA